MSALTEILLAIFAMGIAGGMIYYAYTTYIVKNTLALEDDEITSGLHRLLWKNTVLMNCMKISSDDL